MKLSKDYKVSSVKGESGVNGLSFLITFYEPPEDTAEKAKKWPCIKLDGEACVRFGIPRSMDIIGRTILCSLETHSPIITDRREAIQDDVEILQLQEIRCTCLSHMSTIPSHETVERILRLETRFGERRLAICPFYRLVVPLTEQEYVQFRAEMMAAECGLQCKVTLALKEKAKPPAIPDEENPKCPECGHESTRRGLIHVCLNCGREIGTGKD